MDMMFRSRVLAFALTICTTLAVPWAGPAPTQAGNADLAIKGRSPAPTSLPDRSNPAKLFRRQSDRTCGFVDADYDNPATCSAGYYCAKNDDGGVFGCCSESDINDCVIETACYPSAAAAASCDSSCLANPYNYICTEGVYTFCYQYEYMSGGTTLSAFGCASEDYTSSVYTFYTNGPDTASATPIQFITVTSVATPQPKADTSTTSPVTSSSVPPTPLPSSGSKTPVGAIVGGVVGGLAVIGIAAFAIFFLWRRRSSAQNATPPAPYGGQPVQPYMQQPEKLNNVQVSVAHPMAPGTMSPPMSPPMSPAPPYGAVMPHEYQNPMPGPPKDVHEVQG